MKITITFTPMKQLTITPTTKEIKLVQDLADDKSVGEMSKETRIGVGKIYEQIAVTKMKYDKRTNAGLVYLFFRNGLIK
jgi:hypothetical protein